MERHRVVRCLTKVFDSVVFNLNVFSPGQSLLQQDGGDGALGVHVDGDWGATVDYFLGALEVVLGDHSQRVEDQIISSYGHQSPLIFGTYLSL